jgi:hypothetical protein
VRLWKEVKLTDDVTKVRSVWVATAVRRSDQDGKDHLAALSRD